MSKIHIIIEHYITVTHQYFSDKKLLNSLLSNFRKSVSTLATYGFKHYFSRTLDIVHKHECNEPVDQFFSFSSIPRQYSIPEYKVRRILSVREEFRRDPYSPHQDTVCKPVVYTQKKPTWVNFDKEWIPSDDDLDISDSDSDVRDSETNRDIESPPIETVKNLDTQVTEPLKCISNSVSVSSSKIEQKNLKYAVEQQQEHKEKKNIQENDIYREIMEDELCFDESQCSLSTSSKRRRSPATCRVSENKPELRRPGDWGTDDSDSSLQDDPQRPPLKGKEGDTKTNKFLMERESKKDSHLRWKEMSHIREKSKKMRTVMKNDGELSRCVSEKLVNEKDDSYNFPRHKLKKSDGRNKKLNLAKQQTRKCMLEAFINDSDSSLPDPDVPDLPDTKPEYITLHERHNSTLNDGNEVRYKRKDVPVKQIKKNRLNNSHFGFQPGSKEDYCSRIDEFTSFYDYSSDDVSTCSSDYSNCKAAINCQFMHDLQIHGKNRSHDGDREFASQTNKRKACKENPQDDVIESPAKRIKHNSSKLEDHLVKMNGHESPNCNNSFILDFSDDIPIRKAKMDVLGNTKKDEKLTYRSRTHIIHTKDSLSPGRGGKHKGKCSSFPLSVPASQKSQEFSERSSERPGRILPSLHSDPYRTPEIPKCNTVEKGRMLLPSSPAAITKTFKAKNQDIRIFFNSCSRYK